VEHLDVLIVGAGLSGIDAAYHVQTSLPEKTYAILEMRGAIGGTWDLFRYPGIRSDSDMYTLGFPFRPWAGDKAISDGESILAYVKETAEVYGIDRKIRYHQRVDRMQWSSQDARWTIDIVDPRTDARSQITAGFVFACAGYYDYAAGYTPDLPGRERFRGAVVHPQHWPAELDYSGKRVVVIGSGATAVTLVPEMAKRAAHVTMLQRSPTYIMSAPARDKIAAALLRVFSPYVAGNATRWKNVLFGMAFYAYCRKFPAHAKRLIVNMAKKELDGASDLAHFTPSYNPWDQRLCLVPDADLFDAIKRGVASVVTDQIDALDETGLRLRSGQHLDADVIVTATGLALKVFGGIAFEVDGAKIDPAKTMLYKGMMCSDVPNFAFAIGYTNASWTLKSDLTSRFVVRLLRHMADRNFTSVAPRRDPDMAELALLDFTSGYVQRSVHLFPKQGVKVPWRLYQNYVRDLVMLDRGKLADDVLEFG